MIENNPLIEEIRAIRRQISKEYHHDAKLLVEHYIELEKKHEGRFIDIEEIHTKNINTQQLFQNSERSDV